jgi:hypothetical protein
MMMDKGTNLSMDDEPTIRGTTMSLHLRELEDLCLCGHFNTNPNPILQQSPSSLQSLYVEVSTTTTKKHKIPKSKKHHLHPTRQIHKHLTRAISQTFTNTQLDNPKTTQQKKISKTPNKRFEANQHKVQIHKTPNKKRNSTNHPTPNTQQKENQQLAKNRF